MNPLLYLTKKQFENYLISLKKNPGKLVGYLLILVFLVLVVAVSFIDKGDTHQKTRSVRELGDIIMGFLMFVFWATLQSGLERGATFFKMSDVNLLFTAPLSSKKVLLYGILKQMGTNLLISVFILYQIPTLRNIYNIRIDGGFIIFGGYILMLFAAQICSMSIYMFSNGNLGRKKIIKGILNGILIAAGLVFCTKIIQHKPFGAALTETFVLLTYLPFVGWIKGMIYALLIHQTVMAWGFAAAVAIGLITIITLVLNSNADYYEDVLTATEYTEEVTQAMKKGRFTVNNQSKLKGEKLKQFGIKKGKGAAVLFHKQMLEDKRSGKLGISLITIIQMVIGLGAAYFLGKIDDLSPTVLMLMILWFMTYMQILFTSTERWAAELRCHYLYLIPESGFKKLLYSAAQGVVKAGFEGIIIFVPAGVMLGINPLFIMLCVLARVSYQMLFIGLSILLQRMFGITGTTGIFVLLYLLMVFLFIMPGIVFGVIASVMTYGSIGELLSFCLAVLAAAGYNIIVALIIGLFANQIFSQMELNTKA